MIYIDKPKTFGSNTVFPMYERKYTAVWFYCDGQGMVPCCGSADTLKEALGGVYAFLHESLINELEEGMTIKVVNSREPEEIVIRLINKDGLIGETGRVVPEDRVIRYIAPEEALKMSYEHPEYFNLRYPNTVVFETIRKTMKSAKGDD